MRRLGFLCGILCALILSAGAVIPLPKRMQRGLELVREVTFSRPLDEVSPHILDFESYPKWWGDCNRWSDCRSPSTNFRSIVSLTHTDMRTGSELKCMIGTGSASPFDQSLRSPEPGSLGS